MKPDSLQRGRELVDALSRFCRSIAEIAALQSDAENQRPAEPRLPTTAPSADPKVQLLALTELVQQTLHVLGDILTEVEPSGTADEPARMTRDH